MDCPFSFTHLSKIILNQFILQGLQNINGPKFSNCQTSRPSAIHSLAISTTAPPKLGVLRLPQRP
ncbi:MAG: hypothetical protein IJR38_10355, partial [Selenomonadaceae bacterium]|nr:hypothetical protein [Selenomonadaceae bacterium]